MMRCRYQYLALMIMRRAKRSSLVNAADEMAPKKNIKLSYRSRNGRECNAKVASPSASHGEISIKSTSPYQGGEQVIQYRSR